MIILYIYFKFFSQYHNNNILLSQSYIILNLLVLHSFFKVFLHILLLNQIFKIYLMRMYIFYLYHIHFKMSLHPYIFSIFYDIAFILFTFLLKNHIILLHQRLKEDLTLLYYRILIISNIPFNNDIISLITIFFLKIFTNVIF